MSASDPLVRGPGPGADVSGPVPISSRQDVLRKQRSRQAGARKRQGRQGGDEAGPADPGEPGERGTSDQGHAVDYLA